MRKFCLFTAAVLFVVFLIHWSPWNVFIDGGRPLPEVLFGEALGPAGTHYLELERDFWTAFLFGLFIAFLGEGLLRPRASRPSYDTAEEAF